MAFAVLYLADSEAMKAKSPYENINEDPVDAQPRLLSVCCDACVAHDANGQACSKGTNHNYYNDVQSAMLATKPK